MYEYTNHARTQMERRIITEEEIELAIADPDVTREKGNGIIEYVKQINGYVILAYLADSERVITVIRSSKINKYL